MRIFRNDLNSAKINPNLHADVIYRGQVLIEQHAVLKKNEKHLGSSNFELHKINDNDSISYRTTTHS